MYLEAGNWIQASVQFRNLVASQGTEPRYLIAYIDALLDHSEMTNAEIYLERLEKISPNLIDTSALRARMLVMKNEPDKAFELLKAFVDKPNAQPPDRNVRLRGVAMYLDHLSATTHEAGGETARGTLCAPGGNVLPSLPGKEPRARVGTGGVPGASRPNG